MLTLTIPQQVKAYIHDMKSEDLEEDTREIDGAIIETIELGYAIYDPMAGELTITKLGKQHLDSL